MPNAPGLLLPRTDRSFLRLVAQSIIRAAGAGERGAYRPSAVFHSGLATFRPVALRVALSGFVLEQSLARLTPIWREHAWFATNGVNPRNHPLGFVASREAASEEVRCAYARLG